jgi:hypothetical protein
VANVRPGQTVEGVIVRLEAGAAVEGTVTDPSGRPVQGAQVVASGDPNAMRHLGHLGWGGGFGGGNLPGAVRTDAEGRYRIDSLAPGTLQVAAMSSDYPTATAQVDVAAGRTARADLQFSEGAVIEGIVTANGSPVEGATVFANIQAEPDGGSVHHFGPNAQTRSDADGRYRIAGLPAGNGHINANLHSASGMGNRSKGEQIETQLGMVTEVNFEFTSGTASLEGRVTVRGEAPINGHVSVSGQGEGMHTQVMADGRYELTGLPAGEVHVNAAAEAPGGLGHTHESIQIELVAGRTTRLDFDLRPRGRVRVTVAGIPEGRHAQIWAVAGRHAFDQVSGESMQAYQELREWSSGGTNGGEERDGELPEGLYTVVAWLQGGGIGHRDPAPFAAQVVEVAGGRETAVQLRIR